MDIQEELKRQRVKHIVNSYRLDGEEHDSCNLYLQELLSHYPSPLVELALVESLVDHWLTTPMLRGTKFLAYTHRKLRIWEVDPISSTLTPEQFQHITGLDPAPVFGPQECPPSPSVERTS